ncbi:MAG: NAD-glutamate dehydrogenase [Candidatus Schekmanbacteria bacterium]|nr:NAD-glutamate dehydrogenase [Candidatus Schekmanbacteria bacterium]
MATQDYSGESGEERPGSSYEPGWSTHGPDLDKDLFGDVTRAETDPEASKRGDALNEYIEDIAASVRVSMEKSVAILTPWFFSNMPQFYYQTTPKEEKIRHLHAVITGHIFEAKQKLQLWNRELTRTTYLAPANVAGVFTEIADGVLGLDLKHATMFTSNDRLLLIGSFFTNHYRAVDRNNPINATKLGKTRQILAGDPSEDVDAFLFGLDDDTVIHGTPSRLARLFKLFQASRYRPDAVSYIEETAHQGLFRYDIAYHRMPLSRTLRSILSLFDRHDFEVSRCMATILNQVSDSPLSIFTFLISHKSGEVVDEKCVPLLKVNKAAKTLRWVDHDPLDELLLAAPGENEEPYSLNEVNLIRAVSTWDQIFLSKTNPYYYSEERIHKTFLRFPDLLRELIDYFKVRFDPRFAGDRQAVAAAAHAALREKIADLDVRIEHDILRESLNFIAHMQKTNYFHPRKTGLSFRLNPACLNSEHYPEHPFGFFFLVGRGYRGFHVRFRDIARGGLRLVIPRDLSQYEASLAGLFDETIGLAFAQQLKNKDIPEGGAKAVLLLSPGADLDTAAVGAVDSLLNLITVDPATSRLHTGIIDYYGEEEYIYLGPDENCTNDLIETFVRLAQNQGYRYANAFMSSKPRGGINHKEYGVTSEGISVFLENLLWEIGINPHRDSFTVKMTGGPDGDVAGNELKILHRAYGDRAKVVAIADGYGAAHDPAGLDWTELLGLVDANLPISHFPAAALSGATDAFVLKADTKEHVKVRNTLCAKVRADVFIPAGGRPYTVNSDNWSAFLQDDGKPTMKVVVEGANIFFTESARKALQEAGALMVRDSSANKCGVICSSFEILACLILTPDEFVSIKDVYVRQVIRKLRSKADKEAKLLLREYHERGKTAPLADLSQVLSSVINRVTDVVHGQLELSGDEVLRQPMYDQLILEYAPEILVERYRERLLNDIPRSYRRSLLAADIAARIVYAEGISWLEHMADSSIVGAVFTYMQQQRKIADIIGSIGDLTFENKEAVVYVLEHAGARALTMANRERLEPGGGDGNTAGGRGSDTAGCPSDQQACLV